MDVCGLLAHGEADPSSDGTYPMMHVLSGHLINNSQNWARDRRVDRQEHGVVAVLLEELSGRYSIQQTGCQHHWSAATADLQTHNHNHLLISVSTSVINETLLISSAAFSNMHACMPSQKSLFQSRLDASDRRLHPAFAVL